MNDITQQETLLNKPTLNAVVSSAAKWSSLTEIIAKIVTPVSNMILARLLAPEVFGVLATVTMIFSFADMFTDAGFQRYLVQHEFKNDTEKFQNANIAFWSNLGLSFALWAFIAVFSNQIAAFVGNPGLGNVIVIGCMQLPITSFSSIQISLFERKFDFKTLFLVRVCTISIPFAVTIPLAIFGFSYWSLILGTISGQVINAMILTIRSQWKPKLFYKIKILKEMLSFCIWTLIESVSIWFATWADIFIVGGVFTTYYLGLYKTSLSMVNSLISVVTMSVIPVLFSALSRYQNQDNVFKNIFFKVQKSAAYILFPLGLGMFVYSDLATGVMLGDQWAQAGFIIGIWGITSVIKTVFCDFNSECLRAKGLPKLSFLIQVIYLAFLIPALVLALKFGFETLVYVRAFIRFELVISSMFVMQIVLKIRIKITLKKVYKPACFTIVLGLVSLGFRHISNNLVWNVFSIFLCILIYFILIKVFAKDDLDCFRNKIRATKLSNKFTNRNVVDVKNR